MSTGLEAFRDSAAAQALAGISEAATRTRTTPDSIVNGRTVPGTPVDTAVRVVITARSGDVQEQGWGQTATGEYQAVVDMADGWETNDVLEANEGVHVGKRFRVTFVDAQGSLVALELIHAGNA